MSSEETLRVGDYNKNSCNNDDTNLAASCHSSFNASLTSITKSPGIDSILKQIKPNYHFMNDSPQVIPVSINWPSGGKDQPLAWQAHANNASLIIWNMDEARVRGKSDSVLKQDTRLLDKAMLHTCCLWEKRRDSYLEIFLPWTLPLCQASEQGRAPQ